MSDGWVTYACRQGRHVFRYGGRVAYPLAPAIERCAERALGDAGGALIFDVREATLIDSTNLGLMARLAARAPGEAVRPVIVSGNDDITAVLASMGFDEVFSIVSEHPVLEAPASEEPIICGPPSQGELLETMLSAHRTLMALNDKDRAEFEGVVAWLEAEARGH
jgi:anti-anti-sigma regulatory factor